MNINQAGGDNLARSIDDLGFPRLRPGDLAGGNKNVANGIHAIGGIDDPPLFNNQ